MDGIAQTQINNLNSYVNVVRKEIVDRYAPPKDDRTLAVLEAAVIDEDHYFADRIHRDMEGIICRIKDAHKNDRTTMPESNAALEIIKSLKAASRINGSLDDKLVALFCYIYEIDNKKKTPERARTLTEILKMSPKLKTGYSSRGKYSRK